MKSYSILALALIFALASCKKDKEKETKEFTYNFTQDEDGWDAFFSDYPVGSESFYQLHFSHTVLPAPLDQNRRALKISGNNHSDDLLSLIFKKIDNLKPNTRYAVSFNIELASNVTSNSPGIGGSPDLALGVGGLSYQPESTVISGYYRPNFTSRLQSGQSNDVLQTVGRIGVSNDFPAPFTLVNRNNLSEPINLTTNSKGELWLMIGTDSGFEGVTTLYYSSIKITLN